MSVTYVNIGDGAHIAKDSYKRGRRLVTIEHSLGKKGSILVSNIMRTLLEMAGLKPEITETDVAITMEIPNVGS